MAGPNFTAWPNELPFQQAPIPGIMPNSNFMDYLFGKTGIPGLLHKALNIDPILGNGTGTGSPVISDSGIAGFLNRNSPINPYNLSIGANPYMNTPDQNSGLFNLRNAANTFESIVRASNPLSPLMDRNKPLMADSVSNWLDMVSRLNVNPYGPGARGAQAIGPSYPALNHRKH